MAEPAASASSGVLRRTLLVLFLINFLNFFDRLIPAAVLEPIRQEFDLDDTQLGLLGTAFTLIYALAGLPLGRLADRVSRPKLLAVGVFLWSLMTAASGLARSFTTFFLARLGVGIGEASCAPAANSMIGDLYPAERRARALGLFMLGLPLGNLACFALCGWLAQHYGWRTPFLVAAIPGLLVAALALTLRDPPRGGQEQYRVDASVAITDPFRRVLRIRTLWWIILSGAAVNFAAYALSSFLPSLMVRWHGTDVAQAGMVAAVVTGLTGLVGLTAGGWLADRLHKRHERGRLLLGAACMLLAAPLLWLGLVQPRGAVNAAAALLAAGWLLYFMYYVTVYASLQDVVEPRLRATAMAVYFFFQYILGAGFGSVITGALSDFYARAAMTAAGATEMAAPFRAIGLQSSLALIVPLAMLLTGLALLLAARGFVADAARARAAGSTTAG